MKLATQITVLHEKPEPDKIDDVIDRRFWKPTGGLWTSTLDEAGGQWLRWLTGEGYSLDEPRWGGKLWLLEPTEANVFMVWSPRELGQLVEQFPHPSREIDVYDKWRFVDWVEMSKHYDAVSVPNPWTWRFGHEDMGAGMFFYSMDAECTCWFRWCFEGEPQEVDPAPYLAKLREE